MEYISGEGREQIILLPDSINDYVDENNAVRVIDAYIASLDLSELGFNKTELNMTGRPPYDPKDLLKLYLYGYMNRIRSSRRLERETKRNLEVLWLLGTLSPDHKTIARFRHDNGKALKNVFRDFVKLCLRLDLYGRELIAIDGSKFKAVNAKARNYSKEKLKERIGRIDEHIKTYLQALEQNDREEEGASGEKTKEEIAEVICGLRGRKERYEGYIDELERTGETQKSLTDADSRLMLSNGKMDVCYNIQTAVDAKNKLITEFEVTNKCTDVNLITPMVEQAQQILAVERITAIADAGYDSVQDITMAMSRGAQVHVSGTDFDICVPAKEGEQTELLSHYKGRCVYIGERNIVVCPMGNILYPRFYKKTRGQGVFYNRGACEQCTCKCTKEKEGRGLRHFHRLAQEEFAKPYNDKDLTVKQIRIKADKKIMKHRKSIVEHPFGTVKRAMDGGYCLTKGLKNVRGEFSLIFLAYNLKRVINILGCKKLIASMT